MSSAAIGCQACGESDPLLVGNALTLPSRAYRSCGMNLTTPTECCQEVLSSEIIAIDRAYRAALISVKPDSVLLGQVTDHQFQSLVDDLLDLITHKKSRQRARRSKRSQTDSVSDQPRLDAIVDLISNASPAPDPLTRSNRHRRSLKLWTNILSNLSDEDEAQLKQSSPSRPTAVRARFAHAQIHHERNSRWWRVDLLSLGNPGFKCSVTPAK
jgi:hypothetical protein